MNWFYVGFFFALLFFVCADALTGGEVSRFYRNTFKAIRDMFEEAWEWMVRSLTLKVPQKEPKVLLDLDNPKDFPALGQVIRQAENRALREWNQEHPEDRYALIRYDGRRIIETTFPLRGFRACGCRWHESSSQEETTEFYNGLGEQIQMPKAYYRRPCKEHELEDKAAYERYQNISEGFYEPSPVLTNLGLTRG